MSNSSATTMVTSPPDSDSSTSSKLDAAAIVECDDDEEEEEEPLRDLPEPTLDAMTPHHQKSGVNGTKLVVQPKKGYVSYKDNGKYPIVSQWTQVTTFVHATISRAVVTLSCHAAQRPKTVVLVMTLIGLLLPLIGFATNFQMEVEQEAILAPFNSLSRQHYDWIVKESNFPEATRPFDILVHENGDNVLQHTDSLRRVFEALATFQSTPGYHDICAYSDYQLMPGNSDNNNVTCQIHAATRFWWHNVSLFDDQVGTDAQAMRDILSQPEYPLGTPVGDHDFILGNYETYQDGNITRIVSAQSFIVRIDVPVVDKETSIFEDLAVEYLLDLRDQWDDDDGISANLEFFTFRSIPNEFTRAIKLDLPLYPAVFFIMVGFACITFFRWDRVQSRCLLGLGAVVTIGLSLFTGCGLLFIIGTPLTNLTGSLAFVVFGVGLDDTFIIMGEYNRTDPRKNVVDRVRETIEVVGLSIFVTTMTTMMAFGLGTLSAVPAIRWLCLYAVPTIFIDFIFQVTFFIALLVLDEGRIRRNQRDCYCLCLDLQPTEDENESQPMRDESQPEKRVSPECAIDSAEARKGADSRKRVSPSCANDSFEQWRASPSCALNSSEEGEEEEDIMLAEQPLQTTADFEAPPKTFVDLFMEWYSDFIMKRYVQGTVIVCFLAFLGLATWSATKLKQEFKAEEIVPAGSYVKGFLYSINEYSAQVITVGAYFRDVDQSDPFVQDQMRDYLDQIGNISQIRETPPFCWVRDFHKLEQRNEIVAETAASLDFNKKLDFALSIPAIQEVYGSDIVRDEETGNITASRCWFFVKNVDMQDVQDQTNMLLAQRNVSLTHPANEGKEEFSFFSFDIWYIIWEFYTVALNELILTTIAGVVAVSVVAFCFIPHWTAVFFVTPLITTLYIDLLGTLQMAGISINVVTYVCLVISVGLLVDFLMHILLKYYESHGRTREEKVKETLQTMGPSILVGGLSTFLGVVPLAFSTNEVAGVVFTSFIAMVTLGIGHGLIFLPVVLSLVGPTNTRPRISMNKDCDREPHDKLVEQEVEQNVPPVLFAEAPKTEMAAAGKYLPGDSRVSAATSKTLSVDSDEESKEEEIDLMGESFHQSEIHHV